MKFNKKLLLLGIPVAALGAFAVFKKLNSVQDDEDFVDDEVVSEENVSEEIELPKEEPVVEEIELVEDAEENDEDELMEIETTVRIFINKSATEDEIKLLETKIKKYASECDYVSAEQRLKEYKAQNPSVSGGIDKDSFNSYFTVTVSSQDKKNMLVKDIETEVAFLYLNELN